MKEYDAHKAARWKEAQETLRDVARHARDDDSEETAELVQETARNFSKMVNEYNERQLMPSEKPCRTQEEIRRRFRRNCWKAGTMYTAGKSG
ncbi:MAG: hypothetical protein PUC19_08165 [Ligilactobacillus ruminis]|nr:hypothetical protein [Ligilactobacillus ruminis]